MDSQVFYVRLHQVPEGREYLGLIDQARSCNRGLNKEPGFEIHHILTRALGGGNEPANLVKLSLFEHVLAHYYLALALPCRETLLPIIILSNRTIRCLDDLQRVKIETLEYWAQLREDANRALLGRICINNGRIKKYVSEDELPDYLDKGWVKGNLPTVKGRITVTDGTRNRLIEPCELEEMLRQGWRKGSALKGKPSSKKGRSTGRKFVTDGVEELQVLVEEVDNYLNRGYHLGRKPFSKATRQRLSERLKGCKLSKQECERRSQTGKGRVWCHLGENSRWVSQSEFELLAREGWKPGRKDAVPRVRTATVPKPRKPVSEETRKRQSLAKKGRKKPETFCEKLRTWRWVRDTGGNQLRIQVTELQIYLDQGWKRGRYSSSTVGRKSIYHPETGKKRYVHEEELAGFLEQGWKPGHPATNLRKK